MRTEINNTVYVTERSFTGNTTAHYKMEKLLAAVLNSDTKCGIIEDNHNSEENKNDGSVL